MQPWVVRWATRVADVDVTASATSAPRNPLAPSQYVVLAPPSGDAAPQRRAAKMRRSGKRAWMTEPSPD
jgi:hypothetical protein